MNLKKGHVNKMTRAEIMKKHDIIIIMPPTALYEELSEKDAVEYENMLIQSKKYFESEE